MPKNYTKVTFNSHFCGPYAGKTMVFLTTDSEMDGCKIDQVVSFNLSEAESARIASRDYPGLPMDYLHDGCRPLPAWDHD